MSGCAGSSPGEVSRGALRACVSRGAALNPVCGHTILYASPCLAEAMCFVPPGAARVADVVAAVRPAAELGWRNVSASTQGCG